jgi:hypothetical protein
VEGWVGHPMDPIGCLFSTLLDAANNASSKDRAGIVIRFLVGISVDFVCHANLTVFATFIVYGSIFFLFYWYVGTRRRCDKCSE